MPSTDAARSTPVLPRAAARPTGPERSAPPPNRVSADSGTSTPISNRVSLSARLRGLQRALPAPQPTAGPQGQAGHDEAHARAHRGAVHAPGAAAAQASGAAAVVRRAGHDRRIAGVGGEGAGVPVPVAVLAILVVVLAVVVLLVLLAGITQVRRDLIPGLAGEDRGGERLDPERDELVLGVGMPDRGRPGTAHAALGKPAEQIQGLLALALLVGEQRDRHGLARDGTDEERRLGAVRGAGLGDDLLAVAHAGSRRGAVG